MGFNSAFKGLKQSFISCGEVYCHIIHCIVLGYGKEIVCNACEQSKTLG